MFPFFFLAVALIAAMPAHAADAAGLQQRAAALDLARQPAWRALLHMKDERTLIPDRGFILSHPEFSPQRELELTLEQVASGAAVCRFPARYAWLARQLALEGARDPVARCAPLAEFMRRAPGDEVYLVFASENVLSPASMMGHVFLKLAGTGADGKPAEHAISYFTNVAGANFVKLLFESLVTGKEGFYTLSPYAEKTRRYLEHEQRNVWEYRIKLAPEQKELLLLHLFELKGVELTYYFDRHNCATLTADLLSLGDPVLHDESVAWTSPMDVVRRLHASALLDTVEVSPSSRWYLRLLQRELADGLVDEVRRSIDAGEPYVPAVELDERSRFLVLELARTYARFRHEQGKLANSDFLQLAHALPPGPDLSVDLSQYKQPGRTPPDSQWRVGWTRAEGAPGAIEVGVLPTAHRLEDDHRQYFSESALRLFDTTVSVVPDSGRVRIEEFQLFAVTNLIPADALTGGYSAAFRIGVERQRDALLRQHLAFNVSGGAGRGVALGNSALAYGLAAVGFGAGQGAGYWYAEPEIGLIANEAGSMKSLLSARALYNQFGDGEWTRELKVTQAKYFGTRFAVAGSFTRLLGSDAGAYTWTVTVKRLF